MSADRLVVITTVCAAIFAAGLSVGEDRTRTSIATNCAAQAGEKLISVVQTQSGVVCNYAQVYGRARMSRRAS